MKFKYSRFLPISALAAIALANSQQAEAATGTWNNTGTSWGTATCWTGSLPNAPGDIANLTFNLSSSRTITLDGVRTVGTLEIGDPTSGFSAYSVSAGTGGQLVFDNNGSGASLKYSPAGNTATNSISAPVLLNDNLTINSIVNTTAAASPSQNITGVITDGTGAERSITKTGIGYVTLSGANTYRGGITVSAGRIAAGNASALGSGPAAIASSGQIYLSTASAVYPNAFTIAGTGCTPVTAETNSVNQLGAIRFQNNALSGSVTLAASARIGAALGITGTLNGPLIGDAPLEINSTANANHAGTITLNGNASQFTNTITVSKGALKLGSATQLGGNLTIADTAGLYANNVAGDGTAPTMAGNLNLNAGATFFFDPSATAYLQAANVNLTGTSTLFLTAPVTPGSTTVLGATGGVAGSGAIALGGSANYRAGTTLTTGANSVVLTVVSQNLKWTGATDTAWDFAAANWDASTFHHLDNVSFDDTASGTAVTIASGIMVLPNTITVDNPTKNFTISGAGSISGGARLTKSGDGSLTITNANTYGGGTVLNAGSLMVNSAAALGTGPLTLHGGQLSSNNTTNAPSFAVPTTFDGTVTLGHAANTAGVTFGGINTLAADTTIQVALPATSSNTVNLNGTLTDGASSFKLTKTGSGILRLSVANSYDGGTVVEGGTLSVFNPGALGTGGVTATGDMAGGGMVLLGIAGTYNQNFTLSGSGAVIPSLSNQSGDGALNLNISNIVVGGNITLTGDTRIGGYLLTNATISGSIGEVGAPEGEGFDLDLGSPGAPNGSGTMIVAGTNTYTGDTNLYRAIVRANSNAAFGSGKVTISSGVGSLIKTIACRLEAGANTTLANDLVLSSDMRTNATAATQTWGVVTNYPGDATTLSTATLAGNVEITAAPANGGHFAVQGNAANVLRVSGPITSNIPVLIANGIVEFGGGGSYGEATVMQGTLRPSATNGIATDAVLTLGTMGAATLDLNGNDQTLAGLIKSTNAVTITNGSATAATLSLVPSQSFTYTGAFGVPGQTGTLNLSVGGVGGAVTQLAGDSSGFTGLTTIKSGGTLKLTGTLGNLSSYAVCESGGALDGHGTFGGSLIINSGATIQVDPNQAGSLKAQGDIAVTTGGVITVNLANPSSNPIVVMTSVGGAINATAANFVLANAGTYPSPKFTVVGNQVILVTGSLNLTWKGSGDALWDVATTPNWSSGGPAQVFYNGSGVTFDDSVGLDQIVRVNSTVQPGTITFNNSTRAYTLTNDGGGSVTGTTLTKSGSGTAVIAVPLTLSSGMVLNAGVLEIRPPEAADASFVIDKPVTGTGTLTISNSSVHPVSLGNANSGFSGAVVIAKGALQAAANEALGSGTVTFGNAATQPGDVATLALVSGVSVANPVVVAATAESAAISGAGSIVGSASLTKLGTGVLTIANSNTFTGDTVIEAGTIQCAAANALGADTTIRFGTFNTGTADTILDVTDALAATLSLTPTVTSQAILKRSSGTATLSGAIELNSRNLVVQGSSMTLSGAVSGLGGLVIDTNSPSEPVRLTGTGNSFTGNIQVNSGIFQTGAGGGSNNCIPDGVSVNISGAGVFQVATSDAINGLSGATDSLVRAASPGATLTVGAGNASSTFAGILSDGAGALNLAKTGTGDLYLTGISTATGDLSVSGGRVILNGSAAFLPKIQSGGTLAGTGTLAHAGQADNSFYQIPGIIAPGNNGANQAGTLTIANNVMISAGGGLKIRVADWEGTTPGVANDVLACRKIDWTGGSYTLHLDFSGMSNFAETAKEFTIVTTTNGAFPPGSNVIQIQTTGFTGAGTWRVQWAAGNQNQLVARYTPAAGYASWATSKGLTDVNNAPDMDPDTDGVSNLEEYYLNGNPLVGAPSVLPVVSQDGDFIVLSFYRSDAAETDVTTQIIEYGTTLGVWPSTAIIGAASTPADSNGVIVSVTEDGTNPDFITVKIPRLTEAQSLFARLKLVKP